MSHFSNVEAYIQKKYDLCINANLIWRDLVKEALESGESGKKDFYLELPVEAVDKRICFSVEIEKEKDRYQHNCTDIQLKAINKIPLQKLTDFLATT